MKSLLFITLVLFAIHADAQNEVWGKNTPAAIDQKPEYPGGLQGINDFLSANLVYPPKALKNSIEGKVIVKFIIDTSGIVAHAIVTKSADPLLDSEAVRVVRLMNGWKPGMLKNKKVPVFYSLPINFKLPE